jgi:hypothetical protein
MLSRNNLLSAPWASLVTFYGSSLWLILLAVALVIHAAAYLLVYAGAVYKIYNPFETDVSYWSIVAYLVDQTAKGALFDVMEVFKIDLQSQLHLDARQHWVFGSVIAVWRTFISVTVLATLMYLGRRIQYSPPPLAQRRLEHSSATPTGAAVAFTRSTCHIFRDPFVSLNLWNALDPLHAHV